MNSTEPEPTGEESRDVPASTPAHLHYAQSSLFQADATDGTLSLFGSLDRPAVRFDGQVREPIRFREALSALFAVVGSDYRYAPKDRTAYMAYLRLKRDTAALPIWQAQQAYFQWLLRNDPLMYCILDPLLSVHSDQISWEVFSKDESTYACLSMDYSAFDKVGSIQTGTTNIDFSDALYGTVQQMRDYRSTHLKIGSDAVQMTTETQPEVLEKRIQVPDSWLRGFLQVQSAMTLPADEVRLVPMDIYNALRELRMHGDSKGQRRGLRLELIPGQTPKMILEPWETVLETRGAKFRGRSARVIRIWGRRRLMTIKRILPYVESVDVQLLGSGLPSFWVFRCRDMTLTLGLTGFTSANWSSSLGFDLLLPRLAESTKTHDKVNEAMQKLTGPASLEAIGQAAGVRGASLVESLQVGCQNGQLMFDLSKQAYRYRPIQHETINLAKIQFRNDREKIAHDLLTRQEAVRIVSESRIAGQGLELVGEVQVSEDQRDYRPQMVLADEGNLRQVQCTCPLFRKSGLKEGPCVHLIALRLAYAAKQANKDQNDGPVLFETRAFTRRVHQQEERVQLSLERNKVKYRWGQVGEKMRLQTYRFNQEAEAQASYQQRLEDLSRQGYLDAATD